MLFSVVNVARLLNVDAEDCLRQAADKFTRRFNEVETDMKARGPDGQRCIRGRAGPSVGNREGAGAARSLRDGTMKVKIGKTTFALERGDITDAEVDAIVNAANSELWMGTGVAGTIKRKGGVVIEEEALRQGPIEVGEAVLTVAGTCPQPM